LSDFPEGIEDHHGGKQWLGITLLITLLPSHSPAACPTWNRWLGITLRDTAIEMNQM
jgi:hypothetical protein